MEERSREPPESMLAGSRPRDLIGDIHRQQRRQVLVRLAMVLALAAVLLVIGVTLKVFHDRRQRDQILDAARSGFASGTAQDLGNVAEQLEAGLTNHGGDPWMLGSLALVRAQQFAEFGEGRESAAAALEALATLGGSPTHDAWLARAMAAMEAGRLADAREALRLADGSPDAHSIAADHDIWVQGMLSLVEPEGDYRQAIERLEATARPDASISNRRLLAALYMRVGDGHAAIEELALARERSVSHMGMAADEALYNGVLRQNLGGVASLAEQLDGFDLSPRDQAHASLARGVVHIRLGELSEGISRIEKAWVALPRWDTLARSLALEMAVEAGDAKRATVWIEEAGLSTDDAAIFRAWVALIEGDVMGALADLSKRPQENPRVALIQGLALIEQRRWAEADPWLERANKLLPGRIDVEVALARARIRRGDPAVAGRRLEGLTQEEAHAPRAWTGLGESHLAQATETGISGKQRASERALAKQAFEQAVLREPLPAEALLQLGELADGRRVAEPNAVAEAIDYFERAADTGKKLPRYAERLAAYLASMGFDDRAVSILKDLEGRPGLGHETHLLAIRLHLRMAEVTDLAKIDTLIGQAKAAGADPRSIARARGHLAWIRGGEAARESGREQMRKLLEEDASDTEVRLLYVRMLMDGGDRDRASSTIRRGLQFSPATEHGRLHLGWARIESRSGSRRKAASRARAGWLKMLAANRPARELLDAAELTVRYFHRDKKPTQALSVGQKLTARVPYHSRSWTIRARAALKANESVDARDSAKRALQINDKNAAAHELLGRCQLRFGHRDRARASYRRAIELAKGTPEESDYRSRLRRL